MDHSQANKIKTLQNRGDLLRKAIANIKYSLIKQPNNQTIVRLLASKIKLIDKETTELEYRFYTN